MGKDQIGALIIERDVTALEHLKNLLGFYPMVSFIETATDTDVALLKVIDINPDIVFLEYPVKGKTGKKIIKFIQTKLPNTSVVFVTKSKKYAVDAIGHEVYNYLLKPVVKTELVKILEKVQPDKQANILNLIDEIIEKKQDDHRLKFHTTKGYTLINPNEILFCKAEGHYTELHFVNKSRELTNMFLSKVEQILNPYNFLRISRSMVVNKNYIRKVFPTTDTLILSVNGLEYEIKGSRLQMKTLNRTDFE
ncbi:MAG: LytTR family DNA-binding domain-containing protein [Bacteroidota bacterium]|nr:LytTR family DNA-binding domain-containing protein [Bacteroidota bacterium]